MKTEIEQIKKIEDGLRKLNPTSPFVGNAISSLGAARDNLNWEIEAQEKAKSAAAKKKPVETTPQN